MLEVECSMPNSGCCSDLKSCSILEDPVLGAGPRIWAAFEVVLKSMVIFDIESGRFSELIYLLSRNHPLIELKVIAPRYLLDGRDSVKLLSCLSVVAEFQGMLYFYSDS